jgi:hypothetical protein
MSWQVDSWRFAPFYYYFMWYRNHRTTCYDRKHFSIICPPSHHIPHHTTLDLLVESNVAFTEQRKDQLAIITIALVWTNNTVMWLAVIYWMYPMSMWHFGIMHSFQVFSGAKRYLSLWRKPWKVWQTSETSVFQWGSGRNCQESIC